MKKQKTTQNKYILPVMAVLAFIAVTVMLVVIFAQKPSEPFSFIPPPFEGAAQTGTPEVPEKLGYSKIYREGMEFTAWVCGNVALDGSNADVYFTSVSDNTVWLKLRITDENGNILGETGIIKPNEYVKSVKFNTVPSVGTKIKLKIMAYEPETYYSAGAVSLNTTIVSR